MSLGGFFQPFLAASLFINHAVSRLTRNADRQDCSHNHKYTPPLLSCLWRHACMCVGLEESLGLVRHPFFLHRIEQQLAG